MCWCCRFGVLLMVISIASRISGQQQYQWSCSSRDPFTNLSTLPDLPVKDPGYIASNSQSFTIPNDAVVYSVPQMLDCTKTVSAVEFCYSDAKNFNTEEYVFTLLTFNRSGSSFTVVNTIAVRSTPSPGKCANHTITPAITIQACCDRFSLDSQDRFRLPTDENFAFGIISENSGRKLRGYYSEPYPELIAPYFKLDIDSGIPVIGSTITLTEEFSIRALKMFNFVLGPASVATGPSATVATTTGTSTNTELLHPTNARTSISTSTPDPTTPFNTELSPPTNTRTPTSTSTSPTTSSTPNPTHSSTADSSSSTASPVVSPTPIMPRKFEEASNATPEISLGVIVGIAVGIAAGATICVTVLIKSRKQRPLHSSKPNDTTQHRDAEAAFPDHLSNHYRRMASMIEYQRRHMQIYPHDTDMLTDAVSTSSNEAYGVSLPSKLQDEDLYENIDSMATFCMYSPEQSLRSDALRHNSSTIKFWDDNSHTHVADISIGRVVEDHSMNAPYDVAPNLAYGAGMQQNFQQDGRSGNFEATGDPPAVYSTNQAYSLGGGQDIEHEYADITAISSTSSTRNSIATTSSYLPLSADDQEDEYEDIEDNIESSVQTVMSYLSEAYDTHDELTVDSSNQAYGVGARNGADQHCANGATTAMCSDVDQFNEEQYETIADTIQSAGYMAATNSTSANRACVVQGSGVQSEEGHEGETNQQYEHLLDIHYDTIGPNEVMETCSHQVS